MSRIHRASHHISAAFAGCESLSSSTRKTLRGVPARVRKKKGGKSDWGLAKAAEGGGRR
jgi:hypothetical protein